jgi:uncharacterized protein (DUF2062 family)
MHQPVDFLTVAGSIVGAAVGGFICLAVISSVSRYQFKRKRNKDRRKRLGIVK